MTHPSATAATPATNLHQQAKGSSFHVAMLLLQKDKRKALLTLYALCRALDDAVDDAPTPQAAHAALGQWQKELDSVFYNGTPISTLAREFQTVHRHYHFDYADMQAMMAALQRDAQGNMCCPTLSELEHYCYGVASAVGLMSMQIFGCSNAEARPFAIALGQALQLTNILRDVLTDARLNRIYLPMEILGEAITPEAIMDNPQSVQYACTALAQRARQFFMEADSLATYLPSRAIAPALAMRDVYAIYWRKLEARYWLAPSNGKLLLTPNEKAALTTRASGYLLGKFRPIEL